MIGQKYGMTTADWKLADSLGLKKTTVIQRLQKYKGDKQKALEPLQHQKRNQFENLGKARSTRLPVAVDRELIARSYEEDITISDLIAKAVIQYLGAR